MIEVDDLIHWMHLRPWRGPKRRWEDTNANGVRDISLQMQNPDVTTAVHMKFAESLPFPAITICNLAVGVPLSERVRRRTTGGNVGMRVG